MRKAGEVLAALLNERFDPAFLQRAESTVGLFSSWAAAAAEADVSSAAAHSRIKELEKGLLLVEAEHPGWVQILQTKQVQLLKAVQRRYPGLGIQGISFCLSREQIFTPEPQIPGQEEEEEEAAATVQEEAVGEIGAADDADYIEARKRLEASIKKRNHLK
ncbi:DciA family protein [Leadbettera azotonutricia]|uniref:DUF721 domain-containing protein n=1 Tax=Leadbettera azotonutricia (strain ATCC BAA-888 / DSM 13862 / ZAS-9) TaxID=545695 RepID=F5Y7G6_LEAAZ|nr:DciA family protein [Leadbettera azotonutricia]AEF80311.1 hypothetical protein TREAZ_2336 [Leadbettera azotonutricia ZAS-9]